MAQLSEKQKLKLKSFNLELVSEYEAAKKPGTVQCLICGDQTSSPRVEAFLGGIKRCSTCFPVKKTIVRTTESYKEEIKDRNIIILGDFVAMKEVILHKCINCEYQWETIPQNLIYYKTGCPSCTNNLPWTLERYSAFVEQQDEYKLIEQREPNGRKDKLAILHKSCNQVWSPSISNFARQNGNGTRCPICASSKGEKWMAEACKRFNIEYKTEVTFDECRDTRVLRFDGGLIKNGEVIALLEYDGRQHYEPTSFNRQNDAQTLIEFESIQRRDQIKNLFCKEIHIPLLRLKYDRDEPLTHVYIYNFLIETGFIEEDAV